MIVVDASVLVDLLVVAADVGTLVDRLRRAEAPLHAPEIVDPEVVQAVRRYERARKISPRRGARAVRELAELPLRRHSHRRLLDGMWRRRGNLTAYDAAYVVLAESLDATLLTRDAKLAAAPGHRARIELV